MLHKHYLVEKSITFHRMLIKKAKMAIIFLLFIYLNFQVISITHSESSTKLEVIVLQNGMYDSTNILNAIEEYATSVEATLNIDCSLVKLPPENNNPNGIDQFIESRYLAGAKLFILVGNDLKWPLREAALPGGTPAATPDDGVLSDTNGELSLGEAIGDFTAEVTVSYLFPPKMGVDTVTQVNYVVNAFEKFSNYHQGNLVYERKAVVCGRFNPSPDPTFNAATNRMASACEQIFLKENVVKQELTSGEVISYFEQAPNFFGVAGHGSPQVVETSSTGEQLSYAHLILSQKAPMLLEVFGCWTSGWKIVVPTDPWVAARGYLTEAAIFENNYNIAIVCGNPGPENKAEHSFSSKVLSQTLSNPGATIGELMIGKERQNNDWIFFGDPTIKLDVIGGGNGNEPPVAYIDSISPNFAEEGTNINFVGHATDSDGIIVGYRWRSSLQGEISQSATFSTQSLCSGTHIIRFQALDDYGVWSQEAVGQLTITPSPDVFIISPVDGESITKTITISASATVENLIYVMFYINNAFKGFDTSPPFELRWDTLSYPNGVHTIQAKAYTYNPVKTYVSEITTVTVNNPIPTVTINSPSDQSTVSGICSIDISAEDSNKISIMRFYVDGIIKGYDYYAPFQWSWDTSSYSNGPHTLAVDVFYTHLHQYISSEQITVSVENQQTESAVTIISPSPNEEVSGIIFVSVDAPRDNLNRIYLYVDNTWSGFSFTSPCQIRLNTVGLSNGLHQIHAIAFYGKYPPHPEIRSKTISVIVNNSG